MTNDISATVDALLVVLILCVIFCAGVVIVLNKFFSFLGQQNKINIESNEIEERLQELSAKSDNLDENYQNAIKSVESQYSELLNKVTKKLSCLEQDTQTLIKNTRQITVLYGLLLSLIHI